MAGEEGLEPPTPGFGGNCYRLNIKRLVSHRLSNPHLEINILQEICQTMHWRWPEPLVDAKGSG